MLDPYSGVFADMPMGYSGVFADMPMGYSGVFYAVVVVVVITVH